MRRAEQPPRESPLTTAAVRSPLISFDRVVVDGKPALSVLHRMAYQPGRGILMGHLLVPRRLGLFEVRWTNAASQTGFRESVIFAKAAAGLDAAAPTPLVSKHVGDTCAPLTRMTTRFVSGYVGSAKSTYDCMSSPGGMTLTNSGSPRPSAAPPVPFCAGSNEPAPVMCADM